MVNIRFTGSEITNVGDGTISLEMSIIKKWQLNKHSKSAKNIKKEIKALNNVKSFTPKSSKLFEQLNNRVECLGKYYSQTTQKIYNLKKELGYLNKDNYVKKVYEAKDLPTIKTEKCLYQTPEVVGRMVEINCSAAYLTNPTCDDFIIGYVIDYCEVENEYLVEIPELSGKLHNSNSFSTLKLSGRKYWYCNRDWFEFVD